MAPIPQTFQIPCFIISTTTCKLLRLLCFCPFDTLAWQNPGAGRIQLSAFSKLAPGQLNSAANRNLRFDINQIFKLFGNHSISPSQWLLSFFKMTISNLFYSLQPSTLLFYSENGTSSTSERKQARIGGEETSNICKCPYLQSSLTLLSSYPLISLLLSPHLGCFSPPPNWPS